MISYHFVKGEFFKGYANDKSLIDVSFLEIAEDLARSPCQAKLCTDQQREGQRGDDPGKLGRYSCRR